MKSSYVILKPCFQAFCSVLALGALFISPSILGAQEIDQSFCAMADRLSRFCGNGSCGWNESLPKAQRDFLTSGKIPDFYFGNFADRLKKASDTDGAVKIYTDTVPLKCAGSEQEMSKAAKKSLARITNQLLPKNSKGETSNDTINRDVCQLIVIQPTQHNCANIKLDNRKPMRQVFENFLFTMQKEIGLIGTLVNEAKKSNDNVNQLPCLHQNVWLTNIEPSTPSSNNEGKELELTVYVFRHHCKECAQIQVTPNNAK